MDLSDLDKAFDKILKDFPEAKRKLFEDSGEKMYQKVINNIEATVYMPNKKSKAKKYAKKSPEKTNKKSKVKKARRRTGNLKAGVIKAIGSGGGYAAVKPNWKIAPHTHLIENGHKVVRNGEVVGWAEGKHMYRNALNELADELEHEAEKIIDKLVGDF